MYYSFGYKLIIDNVKKLTASLYDSKGSNALHHDYNKFLNKYSIFEADIDWEYPKIMDFTDFREISPKFSQKKAHHFKKNSSCLDNRLKNGFFEDALGALKNMEINVYNLATLLIRVILVNHFNTYTNGTLEDTLGLSIMNFKDEFTIIDFIELVYHQIVHMSIFLDDKIFPHMQEENKNKMIDTDLIYIHGGKSFPAYIAFHSYMVGVEILKFREAQKLLSFSSAYHGNIDRIIKVTKGFQNSLQKNRKLFLYRGQAMIDKGVDIMSKFTG